jgi:hypothetical protein
VSRATLGRIGQALRLTRTELAYLFSLAGAPVLTGTPAEVEIDEHVRFVLRQLKFPALVLSPCLQVVAFKSFADALFRFADDQTPLGGNHAWRLFMDPRRKKLYVDWEDVARSTVGVLRLRQGTRRGDPSLDALLSALRGASSDFLRLWNEGRPLPLESSIVRMRHNVFGTITVATARFLLPSDPDYCLATLPPADSNTVAAFVGYAGRASTRHPDDATQGL